MANSPDGKPIPNDDQQSQQPASVSAAQQSAQTNSGKDTSTIHWPTFRGVFFGITAVVTVAGLFYVGVHWLEERIDKTVERKLSDESILRKIAAQSRPALLFDANESITADMGAGSLVKNITITDREKDGWPIHILIDFTRHMNSPPILSALNETARVLPSRAKGFAWKFDVDQIVMHNSDSNNWIFRLELAP